jgi:hypothetical protein
MPMSVRRIVPLRVRGLSGQRGWTRSITTLQGCCRAPAVPGPAAGRFSAEGTSSRHETEGPRVFHALCMCNATVDRSRWN